MGTSFEELIEKIGHDTLGKRTYWSYGIYFLVLCVGIGLGTYILFLTDTWWVQCINAIFFAFLFVQLGMFGHDFSHQQVFTSQKANRIGGVCMWSLGGGLSEEGWYQKHNEHHKNVNHLGKDPDLEIPFIFDEAQIPYKSSFVRRYIQPAQHVLFFALLPFVYFSFVYWSLKRLSQTMSIKSICEGILIGIHFLFFIGAPLFALPAGTAVAFLILVLTVGGYYMGLAFAPNHKGKDVISGDNKTTWLDQIVLTRNLNASRASFLFWGGLNFQIEHHLFPQTSRFQYPYIQPVVKAYCAEKGIPYSEVSFLGSMKEIYSSLKENRGE